MRSFEFDVKEMDVLFVSLFQRRIAILEMLKIEGLGNDTNDWYRRDLSVVESMMEKIYPGCVERIDNENAA